MKTTIIILIILVSLLYLKWVLIIVVFPFQVVHAQILKRKAPQPPEGGAATHSVGFSPFRGQGGFSLENLCVNNLKREHRDD